MNLNKIYFKRSDSKQSDIINAMNVLWNCSRLEASALSSEADFLTYIDDGLVCLSYYPEFFRIGKEDFISDILFAGYNKTKKNWFLE